MSIFKHLKATILICMLAYSPFALSQFNYSVYDGDFNQLPDFAALSPIATGTSDVISVNVTNQTEMFGLVFTSQIVVAVADTYEFQTTSDDGSRLYIDGAMVVDNDGLHGAVTVNTQILLNPGSYDLRVEFFEKGGGQVLDVMYRGATGTLAPIPANGELIASPQFSYSVYDGDFNQLPDFSALNPIETGTSDIISVNVTGQTDTFGLVFTNEVVVSVADTYEFQTTSDDGSRLYVDGTLVVDNDGIHAPVTVNGQIFLNPGSYDLRVEFFDKLDGEILDVKYRSSAAIFSPIPANGQLIIYSPMLSGEWGPVIEWPHIAISAANLPDGRVLTWSSTETDSFPANREFTHSAVFNPADGSFLTTDSNFHDMFCAGVATLEDGRIVASGGNPDDRKTSTFNPDDLNWSPLPEMFDLRWYATNITLPNNQIFSTFGKSSGNRSEKFDPAVNAWIRTPNASMQTLLDEHNAIGGLEWFPQLAVQPNGRVFHGGPTPTLNSFDPVNGADNQTFGQPTGARARKWGNVVTYDVGKVLLLGGMDPRETERTLTTNVFLVDLNGAAPVITQGAPMNFPRALSNSVTMPNGEVLVIGGNMSGQNFFDGGSIFPAEIYNPQANSWRVVDSISIPRNYHSTAILLKDARVLSAGGGACGGCAVNHLDGQIYTPPYLFNEDGSEATRPTLTNVPPIAGAGGSFTVSASSDTVRFSMVRLSATTHHINTDQRYLPVASVANGDGTFTLSTNANPNVLISGNYWLFAVKANGTPSMGETLQIQRGFGGVDSDGDGVPDDQDAFPNDPTETTDTDGDGVGNNADAFPTDPAETTDTDSDGVGDNGDAFPNDPSESADTDADGVGDNADAFPNDPTETMDSDGDGLGDNADPFPNDPNLPIQDADGDGVNDQVDLFPNDPTRSSGIWRDVFTGIAGNAIADLTNSANFPDNPTTVEELALFEGPVNALDTYGTRIQGMLFAPETGSYTFWASGDDNVQLNLSTNSNSANKSEIASVPGWTGPRDWTKFPEQQSASIELVAGQAYYLEVLHKEGGGGDNLAVAWQRPSDNTIVVLGTQFFVTDSDGDGVPDSLDAFPNDPTETTDSDGDGIGDNSDPTPFGNDIFVDDFETASGWTLNPNGSDTATTGLWEAANAEATASGATTLQTATAASGAQYLVTEGTAGASLGTNDVDSGTTSIRSPSIELPSSTPIELSFQYYLAHLDNATNDDFLRVQIVGNSTLTALEVLGTANDVTAVWQQANVNLDGFAGQSVYLLVSTADAGSGSLIEAGIDDIQLTAADVADSDGDGVPDNLDAFPNDPTETTDSDGDGVGDNGDAFPNDPAETADSDGDGVGDNADAFPNDPTETIDSDGDGVGDNGDAFPNDPSETADSDGDGVGDNADAFPNDPAETVDSDDDGVGDNGDAFPNDPTETLDSDGDGFGDNSDSTPNGGSNIVALPESPRNSTTLIVENSTGSDRIWNVNPDNDSVSVSNANGALVQQISVGKKPWALAKVPGSNRIYVTNKADASISIIDTSTLVVEASVSLPYGSQPHGIVFNSSGTQYFVVLEALAIVQKRDASTQALIGELQLSGTPRHITMTFDDARLLVSNFITPLVPGEATADINIDAGQAEVFSIDPVTMTLGNTIALTHDDRPFSESQGPGLPNYLNAPVVTFDDAFAFVPSKKDNIDSGILRENFGMTFDQTVRSNTSRIDLATELEGTLRIDFDNASMATGAAVTGGNRYLLVALETSRELAVYDLADGFEVMRLPTGRAPQGVALSSDGRTAYAHNFMDRSISRFDLTEMIETSLPATNELTSINVVTNETLSAEVFVGKQFFYDAEDDRLALDNYISCASCHNDGGQDGRVWDFTNFGEGLRNTIELNGRAATGHGILHWSANFDELQDFEGQIRTLAAGTGLMSDAEFFAGTRNEPLGDPKAGISPDLDAFAAYLESLDEFDESPYRNQDGSLTAAAVAGKVVFESNSCASCHSGTRFTNSQDESTLTDIGTISDTSGERLGGPLTGIDVPTLRDVWKTPPYLHDGSADTLGAAVTAHQGNTVTGTDLDNLVAFLQQIGKEEGVAFIDSDGDGVSDDEDAFPFDPAESADTDGDGVGDNADVFPNDPLESTDTDGDGVGDNGDAFPSDPSESADTDGDGVGDNADAFPNDPTETIDTDSDGVGDNGDAFPNDPSESADTDGDGVGDNADAFPNDPSETIDTDGDGVGDNGDLFPNDPSESADTDGDGVGDNADAFPSDPTETTDTDGDGVGDNGDLFPNDPSESADTDSDGVGDNADAFPNDPSETTDTDSDGVGDNADVFPNDPGESVDTDGDGVGNNGDAFPNDPSESADTDGDGVGDNGDAFPSDPSETVDTDGDGVGDNGDQFPNDPAESADSDGDGVGDNADAFPNDPAETTDTDGDGVGDNGDEFPNDPAESADTDGDGVGDNADAFPNDPTETTDTDGDGVGDNGDLFPNDPSESADTDGDGVGDNADAFPNDPSETTDTDGDGVGDNGDLFPNDPSESADSDSDGVGDNADAFPNDPSETTDTDSDGVGDNADVFPNDPGESLDTDGDGVGNNGDAFPNDPLESADTDGDGVGDNGDAFPSDPSETVDTDGDGVGDNGDEFPNDPTESADSDGDGVGDNADAFPNDPSESADTDGDGVGDNADAFPNDPSESADSDSDGVGDNSDAFPNDPTETLDSDGDGIGDNADPFPNDPNLPTSDTDGDGVSDEFDLFPNDPTRSSGIWREVFTEIGGVAVADMTNSANFPDSPALVEELALFEGPVNVLNNYGTRIQGMLFAPETGSYTFWVSGDDNVQLNLSTDNSPANKFEVASVPGWTTSRLWTKYPEQRSISIELIAGQAYYMEVLHKEGGGGDNVAVAWQRPSNSTLTVIDTQFFAQNIDSDGDGVPDNLDAFPNDPTETTDSDGDGIGDNSDPTPFGNQLFFDDFEGASVWTRNPNGTDSATTGLWEQANAQATVIGGIDYQLDNAVSGTNYLVTGGNAGSSAGTDDVDNGVTSTRSPNIVLPSSATSELSFSYYFAHYSNGASADFLRVKVVGNNTQTVLEELGAANLDGGAWQEATIDLSSFAGQTVYILIETADAGNPSLIEAGIDDVRVTAQ